MPEPPNHPARLPREALEALCRMEAIRSAGPGGQHRNKVHTGVRLTHLPTGEQGMATERRSQLENKHMALFRLRLRLALHHRSAPRDEDFGPPSAYQPSEAWCRRVYDGRLKVNPEHEDFPALLAEVLDRLLADADDLGRTAEALRISRSQLIKFLALEPAALAALNGRRQERGEHPLRSG